MEIERAIGSRFGDYQIDELLGRGGMGVVYRATQLTAGRSVALKLLRPEMTSDTMFAARFEREARLTKQLAHPHIVPLADAGTHDGVLYMAMDYIDGVDLAYVIAVEDALHPRLAAAIVGQVGAALDSASELGLVHRDVKPANVLIETRGGEPHVYLTDFGVSKHVSSQSGLTATGIWVGSIDYAAPEQLQSQAVDTRTDVYALGCLLYEALTGQVPFPRAREVDKMMGHLADPPPRPSEARSGVPAAFDAVVAQAMQKLPDERFASAGELARAALAAAEEAGPAPDWQPVARSASTRPVDRGAPTAG